MCTHHPLRNLISFLCTRKDDLPLCVLTCFIAEHCEGDHVVVKTLFDVVKAFDYVLYKLLTMQIRHLAFDETAVL